MKNKDIDVIHCVKLPNRYAAVQRFSAVVHETPSHRLLI